MIGKYGEREANESMQSAHLDKKIEINTLLRIKAFYNMWDCVGNFGMIFEEF